MNITKLYIPYINGKYGKKVSVGVYVMVKIWKMNGNFGKYLSVTGLLNRFLPRFLPDFYHSTFAIGREYFTNLPNLPRKTHSYNTTIVYGNSGV